MLAAIIQYYHNQRFQKNFIQDPDEIQTHNPPSSRSEGLTSELLEVLWQAGTKFSYNYASHWGLYWEHGGLAIHQQTSLKLYNLERRQN